MTAHGAKAFTRPSVEAAGFRGWVTFSELESELKTAVPVTGGIYVVAREGNAPARYLAPILAAGSTVATPRLAMRILANWVQGAEVLYIGKADNIRRRLREFMRFGQGVPIGHWGGRPIWQLTDSRKLLVAWKETPGWVPKDVETELISAFREAFGKPPFANAPHRRGR